MSQSLPLAASDRVLAIAPHPDDESIACGGLLLAARDAGAARRVVTLTDGDNNPWPQRWIEKRWRIDDAARARWGARRRAEAQAALDQLGVAASERVFLGLPDTGLTSLLMRGADALPAALREQIAQFRPTAIAFPALADRHPDHSAAHIALRLAAYGAGSPARLLAYRVHGTGDVPAAHVIELDTQRRDAKRDAIARHRTQMALSSKRFLAFATPRESFDEVAAVPRDDHPLRVSMHGGVLELRLREDTLHGHREILILLGDAHGETNAWRLPLAPSARQCTLRDAHADRAVATVEWHREAGERTLAMALPASIVPRLGFVKLARSRASLVVFDRYGWQTIEFA